MSISRGKVLDGKTQCERAYQAFAYVTLINVPLTKASHLVKSRVCVKRGYTRGECERHGSLKATNGTVYFSFIACGLDAVC